MPKLNEIFVNVHVQTSPWLIRPLQCVMYLQFVDYIIFHTMMYIVVSILFLDVTVDNTTL